MSRAGRYEAHEARFARGFGFGGGGGGGGEFGGGGGGASGLSANAIMAALGSMMFSSRAGAPGQGYSDNESEDDPYGHDPFDEGEGMDEDEDDYE